MPIRRKKRLYVLVNSASKGHSTMTAAGAGSSAGQPQVPMGAVHSTAPIPAALKNAAQNTKGMRMLRGLAGQA